MLPPRCTEGDNGSEGEGGDATPAADEAEDPEHVQQCPRRRSVRDFSRALTIGSRVVRYPGGKNGGTGVRRPMRRGRCSSKLW